MCCYIRDGLVSSQFYVLESRRKAWSYKKNPDLFIKKDEKNGRKNKEGT